MGTIWAISGFACFLIAFFREEFLRAMVFILTKSKQKSEHLVLWVPMRAKQEKGGERSEHNWGKTVVFPQQKTIL
jgi:hypothetical protein